MRTPYCMTWHDVTCSAFSQPEPGCISCCKACCVTQSAEAHLNGDRYRDIKSFGTFGTMWAWENNTGNGVPDLTAIKKGHAEKLLNFGCQLWMCVVCVCGYVWIPSICGSGKFGDGALYAWDCEIWCWCHRKQMEITIEERKLTCKLVPWFLHIGNGQETPMPMLRLAMWSRQHWEVGNAECTGNIRSLVPWWWHLGFG